MEEADAAIIFSQSAIKSLTSLIFNTPMLVDSPTQTSSIALVKKSDTREWDKSMNIQLTQNRSIRLSGLHFLIATLLVLGLFFRFINIDKKIAWVDECITVARISDTYTLEEKNQKLRGGQVISVGDFQQSLGINPDKNAIDLLQNKLVDIPEHPPLYYMVARGWAEWFSNSVAALRTIAAVISLFVFPCMYWLCWELFGSSLISWMGVAIIAVSPLHVLYAQEARQYSLWIVTILLSSAALLRAMRVNTKLSWITYTATLILGLYSHLWFSLVAVAQGVYTILNTVLNEGFRWSETLRNYLLASIASLIAFAPWIWIILNSRSYLEEATAWNTQNPSLLTMMKRWVGNLSRVFIDLGFDENTGLLGTLILIPIILILLSLVAYSIYALYRQTPKRVWLFILSLTAIPALPLLVMDLTSGKILSGTIRYMIPFYLGIQLAIIYLLGSKIISSSNNTKQQQFWRLVALVLLSGGVLSGVLSSQAEVWWSKGEAGQLTQVAQIVNQASQPLVVGDAKFSRVLSLSYLLKPEVQLQLVNEPNIPEIPSNFSHVFLFNSSRYLQKAIEREYELESLYNSEALQLWQLTSK